jgi:hypothetical protein
MHKVAETVILERLVDTVVKHKQAALLDDGGITDVLYKKIKPDVDWLVRKVKKHTKTSDLEIIDEIGQKFRDEKIFEGLISEVIKDCEIDCEDAEYIIGFVRDPIREDFYRAVRGMYVTRNNFGAKIKKIVVTININLIEKVLEENNPITLDRLITLLEQVKEIIKHEVTHLVRDVETGRITEFSDRMRKQKKTKEFYYTRGHQDVDFEIDAAINAMDMLFKRLRKRGIKVDRIGWYDLPEWIPGFIPAEKGTEAYKKWIKRLSRERLLTKAMRDGK